VDRILELYGIPEVLLAAITQLCFTYLKHLFKNFKMKALLLEGS